MAGIFSRRTDALLRMGLAAAVVLPASVVFLLMLISRSPLGTEQGEPVGQPVEFDHRHHVADEGIDCRYCHQTVFHTASGSYPPTGVCMGCHAQIWNRSELTSLVRSSFFEDRPILWWKVHRLPMFVFFNHAAHVNKGIGCVDCHGAISGMSLVTKTQPLTMGWCLGCHRDPVPHLRPVNRITDERYFPTHDEQLRLATALDVHPRTNCTTCHR